MVYKKSLYGFLCRCIIPITATLTLAACSNNDDNSDNGPPAPAPVAAADTVTAPSAIAVTTIPVLANDTVPPPGVIDPASLVISTQSANGKAVANADGTVTFTPAAGFSGTTTFAYQVANTLGVMSSPTTVTVNVPATWFFTGPPPADLTSPRFFSDGAQLTDAQITNFGTQGLYYNVHSDANPNGEIRGQIIPSSTTFLTDNGDPATGNNYSALLTGAGEVPSTGSAATAYGTIVLDPTAKTISGVLVANGIAGTQAHIHKAVPTASGPIIFPLTGGPTVWTLPTTPITDAQIVDLRGGAYYLNIHSIAKPGGEIRGQLTHQARFAALIFGNEPVVVAPPALPSSGTGVVMLDPKTNQVSGFIKTNGIVAAIRAHIHQGAPGVNGPIIIPSDGSSLIETPVGSGLWVVPTDPALSTLTPAQVTAFSAGNLYYNVHTNLNPGGEIRGPILAANVKLGNATLNGANEVPPVTTNASGTGIMALNDITKLINGNISTTGIVGKLAHVHQAPVNVAGGIIVPLNLSPPLAVSTSSLADGVVGTAYSQSLTPTGGTSPYTWALSAGTTPPAGLNLSAAGVISGTPTTVGTSTFTVQVTDSATPGPAATASLALSIKITAAAPAGVSLATQIQPIFNQFCTSCHSFTTTLFPNLTTGNSFASLVQGTTPSPSVIPTSSATSRLFLRITSTDLLFRMPRGQPLSVLSAPDIALIQQWIDQGALNN